MDHLFQLPGGQWVRPACISSVKVLDSADGFFGRIPARVVVHAAEVVCVVHCESRAEAQAVADKLAADINKVTASE